ncbi:LytTR family DNA-binding domain-containing protein [Emticicia sp. BO119]|uniref:LytR/AlgR family response regulator transcription factor n=1 Tax=Emticicia sp. BO119 TaxID=2757768 RepID=UPI0015F0AFA5|nr:LytTR family DNA-binding domain-containing protein [Emticicia sp. BO119]MBA4849775.1 LytTR family transcriptional regulator DNA-binding domain-containing protein [Emticicia sp. BO119]
MNTAKQIVPNEIVYLEADQNYSILYLNNGRKSLSAFTLKHYHNKVEINHFLRIHRSFLLNPNHICNIYKVGRVTFIEMSNGKEIPVSRRKKTLVENL